MKTPLEPRLKVRLKTDLTRYHPALIPGSEGYTIGVYGQCSKLSARYTGVWFPGIRILDVDCAALEISEEKLPARRVPDRRERQNPFKRAFKSIASTNH